MSDNFIKLNVDDQMYKTKPTQFAGRIRNSLCNPSSIRYMTPEEIMQAIRDGRSFTPSVMTGTEGNTWESQQLICADIDNDYTLRDENGNIVKDENGKAVKKVVDNPLTPAQAEEVLREHHIDGYFMYYSFSNSEWLPKFRVVVILDEALTDPAEASYLTTKLAGIFYNKSPKCSDTSVKDNARLFYGGRSDCIISWTKKKTSVASLKDLPEFTDPEAITPMKTEIKTQRKEPINNGVNGRSWQSLQDKFIYDKNNFDLDAYITQTSGSKRIPKGRKIFFNPCPICGHNDDFCVSGGLYHCFSSSTPDPNHRGGTILDYLMTVDNLDYAAASEKFKYEIMRYDRHEWAKTYAAMMEEIENERIEKGMQEHKEAIENNQSIDNGTSENKQKTNVVRPISEYEEAFWDRLNNRKPGIKTNIKEIDIQLHGGFHNELYVMAAPTGTGKSALAAFFAQRIAYQGINVLYFALEMTEDEFIARGASAISLRTTKDKNKAIKYGDILYEEYDGTLDAWSYKDPKEYKWYVDKYFEECKTLHIIRGSMEETTAQSICDQVSVFRKKHPEEQLIVFVDYLQILSRSDKDKDDIDQVKNACHKFKILSMNEDIPVFVISSIPKSENNKSEMTESSFKGSNDVAFTGGVLIGWTVSEKPGKTKDQILADFAKNDTKGWLEYDFNIIKFRSGSSRDAAKVYYYPAYNLITDNLLSYGDYENKKEQAKENSKREDHQQNVFENQVKEAAFEAMKEYTKIEKREKKGLPEEVPFVPMERIYEKLRNKIRKETDNPNYVVTSKKKTEIKKVLNGQGYGNVTKEKFYPTPEFVEESKDYGSVKTYDFNDEIEVDDPEEDSEE